MQTSKTIFENARVFIKGKQKVLLFLLLTPILIGAIFESLNSNFESLVQSESHISIILIFSIFLFIVWTVRFLVNTITPFAILNFINSAHDNKNKLYLESYKIGWNKVLLGIILQLIVGIIIFSGIISFIIPGIYLAFTLMFANYVYIINDKNIRDSIIYSFHIAQGNILFVIKKYLYLFGRGIIFALPFLISIMVFGLSIVNIVSGQLVFIALALLALPGILFFGLKTIQVSLISQEYLYQVYLMVEQSKGEITEKALIVSKQKLKKIISICFVVSCIAVVSLLIISVR
jgi:hypothetical protein